MALTNKLTAIANAIRAKTGKSAALSLDDMVTEIGSISGGGGSAEDGRWSVEDFDMADADKIYINYMNSVCFVAPKGVNSITHVDLAIRWSTGYHALKLVINNNAYGSDKFQYDTPPEDPNIDECTNSQNVSKFFNYKGNSSTLRQRLYYHEPNINKHFASKRIQIIKIPSNIEKIYFNEDFSSINYNTEYGWYGNKNNPENLIYFENEVSLPQLINITYKNGGTSGLSSYTSFAPKKLGFICKSRTQYDNILYQYRNTNNIYWKTRHSLTAMEVTVVDNIAIGASQAKGLESLNIVYNKPYLDFDGGTTNLSFVKVSGVDYGVAGTGTFKLVDSISGVESNEFEITFAQPVTDTYIKINKDTTTLTSLGYSNSSDFYPVNTGTSIDGHPVYEINYSSASFSDVIHSLLKIKFSNYAKNEVKMYVKGTKSSSIGSTSLVDFQNSSPSYSNWTNPGAASGTKPFTLSTAYQFFTIPYNSSKFTEQTQYIDFGRQYYSGKIQFYFDDDVIFEN